MSDLGSLATATAARLGPRPFLTFYDDASGERTELGHATFHNWTSKAANLLTEELELDPSARCAVLGASHWTTLVVVVAAWRAGLHVFIGDLAALEGADAVVVAEQRLVEVTPRTGRILVLGAGLGGRATTDVGDVLVFGEEVLAFGDDFVDEAPASDAPALTVAAPGAATTYTHRQLLELAGAAHETAGRPRRILSTLALLSLDGLVRGPIACLASGASLVQVANADPDGLRARAESEKADVVVHA